MKQRTLLIAILVVVLVSILVAAVSYPQLPARGVTHWNAQGQPDGYSSRFGAAFIMPIMLVATLALVLFLPRIDPRRFNAAGFRQSYYLFTLGFAVFMLYLQVLMTLYNLGIHVDMLRAMIPGIALLDFVSAYLMRRAQPNWFIGIRTPWTLSSDQVWAETHAAAYRGFLIAGALALFGLVFPSLTLVLVVVPILLVSIYAIIYSYIAYQRIHKAG